jgi:hypothetical protein
MTLLFFGLLLIIAAGSVGLLLMTRMRLLDASVQSSAKLPDGERYRPMLRILSEEDLDFAGANRMLRKKILARRREIFRGYLRCLTKDYARLLSGLRRTMVESGVDRPDLAGAIAKNRFRFALVLCRIEVHLQLHALGIGKVDVSGLVEALDALRGVVNVMTPVAGSAY